MDTNVANADTNLADPIPAQSDNDRTALPEGFFRYVGPSETLGNSLYRCLKCATGQSSKPLSCHNRSRQNLKKHVMVNDVFFLTKTFSLGGRVFTPLCTSLSNLHFF
jgi:hypothetical protein